jgi:hypothetical protein
MRYPAFKFILLPTFILLMGSFLCTANSVGITQKKIDKKWKIHDESRPLPPVVDPGPFTASAKPPSDAIVLFDGKDLSDWTDMKGNPSKWKVENGYMESVKKAGMVKTKKVFGDCQLHVEFRTPLPVKGDSQGRGNSGVFLMEMYEVQVLDSYENKTYADGMVAAVYGQFPPLVNASRPPGEWQTYDIIFRRPHFDEEGKLTRPAYMTVFHNGILVQDNVELCGPTAWKKRPPYKAHPDELAIALQDHGNPVRFRNIWIREL